MAYAPAANTTQSAGLTHLATVYYRKVALDRLYQSMRFQAVCEPDDIPKRSGKTVQWFRFSLLSANTTPSAEGVIGNGLPLTSTTVSATVDQYSDFTSVSTLLIDTAINDMVSQASDDMAYRATLTVDQLCRNEFDSNSSAIVSTIGAAFAGADVRSQVSALEAANVKPREGGDFIGIIHPYVKYDLQSDNTAGGFIDVVKYSQPEKALTGEVGKIAGCRFLGTTGVTTSGTAPNVLYYTYIVGKGGVGAVSLAGRGPQMTSTQSAASQGDQPNFNLNVIKGGPSASDPEGQIGAYVSYFFVFAVKTLDSTNYRYKIVKADASLV